MSFEELFVGVPDGDVPCSRDEDFFGLLRFCLEAELLGVLAGESLSTLLVESCVCNCSFSTRFLSAGLNSAVEDSEACVSVSAVSC